MDMSPSPDGRRRALLVLDQDVRLSRNHYMKSKQTSVEQPGRRLTIAADGADFSRYESPYFPQVRVSTVGSIMDM